MVGASKILTVSYGTFSCTLEGFDDPFSAMRSIAEYFRDLAADDRYFGAEPPTPDAEMLHRIAEQEVQRRVEARVETNGVVLRQMETNETTQATPAAAVAEGPVAPQVDEPVAEETTEETPEALAEELVEAVAETEDEEIEEIDLAELTVAEDDGESSDDPAPSIEDAFVDAVENDGSDDAPLAADAADDDDKAEVESHESVAEKLSRIRAAVSGGAPAAVAGAAGVAAVAVGAASNDASEADDDQASDETLASAFADTQEEVAFDDVPEALLADEIGEVAEDASDSEEITSDAPDMAMAGAEDVAEADVTEFSVDDSDQPEAVVEETSDADPSLDAGAADVADNTTDSDSLVLEDAVLDATDDDSIAEDGLTLDDDLRLGDAIEDESAELAKLDGIEEELAPIGVDDEDDLAGLAEAVAEDTSDNTTVEARPEPVSFPEVGEGSDEVELMPARVVTLRRADPLENNLDEDNADDDQADHVTEDDEDLLRELASIGEDDDEVADAEDMADDQDIAIASPAFEETAAAETEDLPSNDEPSEDSDGLDGGEDLDMAIAGAMAADREEPAPQPDAPTAVAAKQADDPVDRILEETNSQLDDSEGTRRRSAIAHLKAAVAATKADRLLKRMRLKEEVEQEEQKDYRDDLAQVVRPRRPATEADGDASKSDAPKAEKSEERPLMLVSEQRVDGDAEPESDAAADDTPKAAVRPARVTTDMIRPRRATNDDLDDLSDEDGDENLFEPDESFSDFAEKMGATELPDVLEAAAAYSAFVEGQKHFSRPQLMKRVASFEMNEEFTREAGLRSFGQLLRQGKIQKLKRGQFTIREDTRFRPEARIAGE